MIELSLTKMVPANTRSPGIRVNAVQLLCYTTDIMYWNSYFLTRQIISITLDNVVITVKTDDRNFVISQLLKTFITLRAS